MATEMMGDELQATMGSGGRCSSPQSCDMVLLAGSLDSQDDSRIEYEEPDDLLA